MTGITELEDLIVSEARKQGVQPNSAAMVKAALDLAGSEVVSGNIMVAGKALAPRDYVTSLRAAMPSGFGPVGGHMASIGGLTLTEQMRRKVAASRSRTLPADWHHIRKNKTGITARMMDAVAASRATDQ